jgi:hypothetical protein
MPLEPEDAPPRHRRTRLRLAWPTTAHQIVQKLWNYCNIVRDDGLSYGDYVEQLTLLLFLKMADEQSRPLFNRASPIPKGFGWDVAGEARWR